MQKIDEKKREIMIFEPTNLITANKENIKIIF